MGEPLPYDSEDNPTPPTAPRPNIRRADWLVGAEEADSAGHERSKGGDSAPRQRPVLARPEVPNAGIPRNSERIPSPFPGHPPAPQVQEQPAMPTWEAGKSSVPRLRPQHEGTFASASPIPELARDFPMDDAEERARVSARMAEQRAEEKAIASRPHEVVAPQEFELPVVATPWWTQVPQLIATDRRVQLALLAVVLIFSVIAMWPREELTTSVGHLKNNPKRYADVPVRVRGLVSEVFPVGGSWAYTLVQGRDTIVVFSRTRRPKVHDRLVVIGTLSSGFLDGQSRLAIFESTTR